jgi:hypothetical protein
MYPRHNPYQNPYYTPNRGPSPPRNNAERPRPGYYPGDYRGVSPLGLEYPDFGGSGSGGRNLHYPRGNGGYYQGGAPGEWEFWR